MDSQEHYQAKIIAEYSKEYCHLLEMAYGNGMMSEGGAFGIEQMFAGINVKNKTMLDIGFGLGGVAIYLAEKYQADVNGIEINPWMIEEATKRIPQKLKHLLSFHLYKNNIAFPDKSFDIVYSKGVLCHLEDKTKLFYDIFRVLKNDGQLVIVDWLSPSFGKWSENITKMCELEDLTLFAETETSYRKILLEIGFKDIKIYDENQNYAKFNHDIAERLQQKEIAKACIAKFSEQEWHNSIEGYLLIAKAIENQELLIRRIVGQK